MKKTVVYCLAVLILFVFCTSTVGASVEPTALTPPPTVAPRWMHTQDCVATFNISNTGTATVSVNFTGYSTFFQAKLSVEFQKKTLGLFWRTVDIGYPNNQWVTYSYSNTTMFTQSFAFENSGTYRANIVLEITGTDGSVDVIETSIEDSY